MGRLVVDITEMDLKSLNQTKKNKNKKQIRRVYCIYSGDLERCFVSCQYLATLLQKNKTGVLPTLYRKKFFRTFGLPISKGRGQRNKEILVGMQVDHLICEISECNF